MRPSNKQRSRNKPGGNGGGHNNNQRRSNMGNIINRVFESAGPDGKVRGTPQQIIDKYQALARDAQVSGDRVAAESYLQHAEHYSRLLGEAQRQQQEARAGQERDDFQRGEEGGFDMQRRPQPSAQPSGSGLTMIDADDPYEMSGPIETPEGRRDGPLPVVQVAPRQPVAEPEQAPAAANGGDAGAEAPVPQAESPRRARPRRRPRAEGAPEPAQPGE
jgi:Domain of unknown function (DUF4167)